MLNVNVEEHRFIEIELFTDSFNEMLARYGDFMQKHPNNPLVSDMESMWLKLAVAYRKSRIYIDSDHLKQWNVLLRQADDLLRQGETENVLTKLRR